MSLKEANHPDVDNLVKVSWRIRRRQRRRPPWRRLGSASGTTASSRSKGERHRVFVTRPGTQVRYKAVFEEIDKD